MHYSKIESRCPDNDETLREGTKYACTLAHPVPAVNLLAPDSHICGSNPEYR